jgi:hypothetical protein
VQKITPKLLKQKTKLDKRGKLVPIGKGYGGKRVIEA